MSKVQDSPPDYAEALDRLTNFITNFQEDDHEGQPIQKCAPAPAVPPRTAP